MSKVRLIQLAAVGALLSLAAPAMALPRSCFSICNHEASCGWLCSIGNSVTSCGALHRCADDSLAAGAAANETGAALAAIFAQPKSPSGLSAPPAAGHPAEGVEGSQGR